MTGRSTSTIAAWKAGVDHAGKIYCAGPKYQYAYAGDHIHLLAGQYDRLGVKYAEVFYEVVMLGHDWQPLQPVDVTRDGQTISVRFHVPNPPLAWDEAFGAPHQFVHAAWKNGRGFEVEDSQGEVTITDAVIDGDTIRIGIDRLPDTTGAPLVVRYAMTQDATTAGGRPGQRPLRPAPRFGSAGRRRRGRDRLHRDERFDGRHAGDGGRLHAANRARHGRRRRWRRGPGRRTRRSSALNPSSASLSNPWTGATGPGTAALSIEPVELCGRVRADRAVSRLVVPEVP